MIMYQDQTLLDVPEGSWKECISILWQISAMQMVEKNSKYKQKQKSPHGILLQSER